MRKPQADILNDLLQGELAAVETYTQAMDKVDSNHGGPELKQIRAEHHNAANILLQQITKLGAEPETNSGAWGLLAKAVEGAAKMLGPAAALKALKEGEESGVRMYERALQENRLSDGFHEMIQYRLLPQTQAHIPVIDRLISIQS